MNGVYIYKAKRTHIGKLKGQFRNLTASDLMARIISDLLGNIKPEYINDVIVANAVGPLGNIARLSLLKAGLPLTTPGTSIDFQCGGGLKAVEYGFYQIACGKHDLIIAGGTESTSTEPIRYYNSNDPRSQQLSGPLTRAQFAPEELGDVDMLKGADNTAKRFGLTRQMMDEYAHESHTKALKASSSGYFDDLISQVIIEQANVSKDENLRPNMSIRLLQKARPLLENSHITPGNACLMHDGAAGVLIGSHDMGRHLNLRPLARLIGFKSVGCDPNYSPLGPIEAVNDLLEEHLLEYKDIKTIEINEAFSAKVLAFHKATGYPLERINISGGALAFGHPYAASGAIYLGHLIKNLEILGGGYGIVTLGVAGGQGIACLIEV